LDDLDRFQSVTVCQREIHLLSASSPRQSILRTVCDFIPFSNFFIFSVAECLNTILFAAIICCVFSFSFFFLWTQRVKRKQVICPFSMNVTRKHLLKFEIPNIEYFICNIFTINITGSYQLRQEIPGIFFFFVLN